MSFLFQLLPLPTWKSELFYWIKDLIYISFAFYFGEKKTLPNGLVEFNSWYTINAVASQLKKKYNTHLKVHMILNKLFSPKWENLNVQWSWDRAAIIKERWLSWNQSSSDRVYLLTWWAPSHTAGIDDRNIRIFCFLFNPGKEGRLILL